MGGYCRHYLGLHMALQLDSSLRQNKGDYLGIFRVIFARTMYLFGT